MENNVVAVSSMSRTTKKFVLHVITRVENNGAKCTSCGFVVAWCS